MGSARTSEGATSAGRACWAVADDVGAGIRYSKLAPAAAMIIRRKTSERHGALTNVTFGTWT